MSCSQCTTTPKLPTGPQAQHINAAHRYILKKINSPLHTSGIAPELFDAQLAANTDDFAATIQMLGSSASLTELECQHINILPLAPGEPMDFGKPSAEPLRQLPGS